MSVDGSGRRSKTYRRAGRVLAAVCAVHAVTLVVAVPGGNSPLPGCRSPGSRGSTGRRPGCGPPPSDDIVSESPGAMPGAFAPAAEAPAPDGASGLPAGRARHERLGLRSR
ncbi:MAG TPA: hypothetical protein VN520_31540 [Streptomyces sp.]|uniref:hypothetical protein n=1 Tax=Streptomyces sp. TaxID=1931 RepID=UPI002C17D57F|nr:hypothetical protein [Streptomyces sp.]HWU10835.1 hypothetical protein [Streptomyces sp.]